MKISRTASRARNNISNEVVADIHSVSVGERNGNACFVVSMSDVEEFGNSKTHYDYDVSFSVSEFIDFVKAAASCAAPEADLIRKELSPQLAKLIKLVNMCAD